MPVQQQQDKAYRMQSAQKGCLEEVPRRGAQKRYLKGACPKVRCRRQVGIHPVSVQRSRIRPELRQLQTPYIHCYLIITSFYIASINSYIRASSLSRNCTTATCFYTQCCRYAIKNNPLCIYIRGVAYTPDRTALFVPLYAETKARLTRHPYLRIYKQHCRPVY